MKKIVHPLPLITALPPTLFSSTKNKPERKRYYPFEKGEIK